MSRAVDLAPSGPLALPITGLGRGWEATAIMTLTLILLSVGLVTLYSASAFLAQRQALPDYYYVSRQATGVAVGLAILGVCARIPHDLWRRLAWPMVIVAWLLLVIVVAPGDRVHRALDQRGAPVAAPGPDPSALGVGQGRRRRLDGSGGDS